MTSQNNFNAVLTSEYRYNATFKYSVSNALSFVWLSCDPAFRAKFDIEDDGAVDALIHWWMQAGRQTFSGIADAADRSLLQDLHLSHFEPFVPGVALSLTPLLSLILRHRSDLSALYDVDTHQGVCALWYWWLLDGRQEYFGHVEWLPDFEFRHLHRSSVSLSRADDGLRPTPLLSIVAGQSQALDALSVDGGSDGRTTLWKHFLASEVSALRLPRGGVPYFSTSDDEALLLPDAAILAYGLHEDLREAFDLSKATGRDGYLYWWLKNGVSRFPEFDGVAEDVADRNLLRDLHLSHFEPFVPGVALSLTPLLSLILRHRSDLSALYDVDTHQGVCALWYWWLLDGRQEYFGHVEWLPGFEFRHLHRSSVSLSRADDGLRPTPLLSIVAGQSQALDALSVDGGGDGRTTLWKHFLASEVSALRLPRGGVPYFSTSDDEALLLPDAAILAYGLHEDLREAFDLSKATGRDGYLYWWLKNGVSRFPEFDGVAEDVADRNLLRDLHLSHFEPFVPGVALSLTPLLSLILRHRSDLSALYDVDTHRGVCALWYWWLLDGRQEYFGHVEWLPDFEFRHLHRSSVSLSRADDGLRPTLLLSIVAGQSQALDALSVDGGGDGRTTLWKHFLASEVSALRLPRGGVPYFSTSDDEALLLPDAAILAYGLHEDLREAFDLSKATGRDGYLYWWLKNGVSRFPEFDGVAEDAADRNLLQDLHLSHFEPCASAATLSLTPLLSLILRHRSDLSALYDVDTHQGVCALWYWWLLDGRQEYLGHVEWLPDFEFRHLHRSSVSLSRADDGLRPTPLLSIVAGQSQALDALSVDGGGDGRTTLWRHFLACEVSNLRLRRQGVPYFSRSDDVTTLLPDAAILAYGLHDDIRQAFDLSNIPSRDRYLYWWLESGISRFPEFAGASTEFPDGAVEVPSLEAGLMPLLLTIWQKREDLRDSFDVSTVPGRREFLYYWLDAGYKDYPLVGSLIHDVLIRRLRVEQPRQAVDATPSSGMPLLDLVWQNRTDLQAAFDIDTVEGRDGLRSWWEANAPFEYPAIAGRMAEGCDDVAEAGDFPGPAMEPRGRRLPAGSGRVPFEAEKTELTVSLVGYPRGEFGLGEDIRLLRASLETAGLTPGVVRAPWKIMARQQADQDSLEADLADFETDVMFYVMPAFDTATLLAKLGPRAFRARRRIGFWQWELERFPEPAKIAMELVDEIWCHSEHSARAFRGATDKPVIKVPLPVSVPEVRDVGRSIFGLPEDGFVVFTSFDGASSISRKNPLGAIAAFQAAFPADTHPDARLLVKAMNISEDSLWRECLRRSYLDRRIQIRNEVLDRADYYSLLKCCDAVVSLHRAEGFGRLMAEAMALEIPVVATGYSGNLDFMNADNSWVVPGDLVPLFQGDYPFYEGQVWMEPDVEMAARALRECADDSGLRLAKIARARQTIAGYDIARCGARYRELLMEPGN